MVRIVEAHTHMQAQEETKKKKKKTKKKKTEKKKTKKKEPKVRDGKWERDGRKVVIHHITIHHCGR